MHVALLLLLKLTTLIESRSDEQYALTRPEPMTMDCAKLGESQESIRITKFTESTEFATVYIKGGPRGSDIVRTLVPIIKGKRNCWRRGKNLKICWYHNTILFRSKLLQSRVLRFNVAKQECRLINTETTAAQQTPMSEVVAPNLNPAEAPTVDILEAQMRAAEAGDGTKEETQPQSVAEEERARQEEAAGVKLAEEAKVAEEAKAAEEAKEAERVELAAAQAAERVEQEKDAAAQAAKQAEEQLNEQAKAEEQRKKNDMTERSKASAEKAAAEECEEIRKTKGDSHCDHAGGLCAGLIGGKCHIGRCNAETSVVIDGSSSHCVYPEINF